MSRLADGHSYYDEELTGAESVVSPYVVTVVVVVELILGFVCFVAVAKEVLLLSSPLVVIVLNGIPRTPVCIRMFVCTMFLRKIRMILIHF